MREYELVLRIKILKYWADLEDFELELENFNKSNKGIFEVRIVEKEEVENDET